MAFLCPSRLGRKQKKDHQSLLNKISETPNIDSITLKDLIKLSWTTPEARRIILQNFTAYAEHELTVKQGQKVRYIYREGDWAYIVTNDKKEGFVPYTVLAKLGVPAKQHKHVIDTGTYTKKTIDIRQISLESEEADLSISDNADDSFVSSEWSNDSVPANGSLVGELDDLEPDVESGNIEIPEENSGTADNDVEPPSPLSQYRVITDYIGQDNIEVTVRSNDIVHLLNTSDPHWYWVRTPDGSEGYMPSYYITKISATDNVFHNGHETISTESNIQSKQADIRSHIDSEYEHDLNTTHCDGNSSVFSEDISYSDRATASDIQPSHKKQRPAKPPRKNKPKSRNTSQNLDESVDSVDSILTDSTMDVINDSVFDYSFSESFRDVNGTLDSDDVDSVLGNTHGKLLSSGLPYRDMIGLHLKPDTHKQRRSSQHEELLRLHSKRRSAKSRSEHEHHNSRKPSKSSLQNRHSSKYSEYSMDDRKKTRPLSVPALSVPAFTSFHESRNGYFDEYFYEDGDNKFTDRDDHGVINVSEILKMRQVKGKSHQEKTTVKQERETHGHAKSNPHSENPKIKPFLFNLPSTNIDTKQSKYIEIDRKANKTKEVVLNNQRSHSSKVSHDKNSGVLYNNNREINGEFQDRSVDKLENNHDKLSVRRKHHSSTDSRLIGNHNTESKPEGKKKINVHSNSSTGTPSSKKPPVMKQYNSVTDLRATSEHTGNSSKGKTKPVDSRTNKAPEAKFNSSRDKNEHTHKGKRQYKSSSDLRSNERDKAITQQSHHKQSRNKGSVSSDHGVDTEPANTRRYNSSTDLRHMNGPPDWSFGYPRKTRHASGGTRKVQPDIENKLTGKPSTVVVTSKDTSDHENKRPNKQTSKNGNAKYNNRTDSKGYDQVEATRHCGTETTIHSDLESEENMAMLLSQTESLLHMSDNLLDTRIDRDPVHQIVKHEPDTRINSEANEKCSQFLTNSTIGITGMVRGGSRDSETVNTETKQKPKVVLKSIEVQTDLNEDMCSKCSICKHGNKTRQQTNSISTDVRGITEFVSQCHYEPESDNMLPMRLGEIVHVGLDGQDNDQWYWAFSPRLRQYGYIPKQHVKIPMVTII